MKGVPAFLLNYSRRFATLRALNVADRWSFGDRASMVIVMKKGSSREDLARVTRAVEQLGFCPHVLPGLERTAVGITGNPGPLDPDTFERLPGVARAIPISLPFKLASREMQPRDTVVRVGSKAIGGGGLFVIAGPCAVETAEQILETARLMKLAGADALRGGAFKPRSSPYSFQGLGKEGLVLLAKAREATGLAIVTEAVDEASLELVGEFADVVQIGARNMQNYELLKRVGRLRKPVLLKRGLSATLEDLLLSAEYVLAEGNPDVILCERGIRTFSRHSRYTLDLSVVPAARSLSHLPIVVDPSHAVGRSDRVPSMARAAVAAGADGVMIEVHPVPGEALSDGRQALLPQQSADLIAQLRAIAAIVSRKAEALL
jgi:3-deoxy-7-phosphoheptulonate synthase